MRAENVVAVRTVEVAKGTEESVTETGPFFVLVWGFLTKKNPRASLTIQATMHGPEASSGCGSSAKR